MRGQGKTMGKRNTTGDAYLDLVNGPLKLLAKQLGLPRPVPLRRFGESGSEPAFQDGPVLILGRADPADAVAGLMLDAGFAVHRHRDPSARYQGIIAVLAGVEDVDELAEPALTIGAALRSLRPCSRIITISDATDSVLHDPARAATAQAVLGLTRSLGQEMRAGTTANGILLNGAPITAPSVASTLAFLLSAKSAYIDGQFLTVDSTSGRAAGTVEMAGLGAAGPLAGRTAVVTGAARGIGAAIARVLSRDGATVYGVDIPAAGQALAATMNEVSGVAIQLDITAPDAGARIVEAVGAPIDVLINNAGITRDRMLANMEPAGWESVLAVNLKAELALDRSLNELEAWGEHPHVVALASTSGIAGNKGQTNYAAAKAGVIGLTRAAAAEFAARGGTINAVAPGFIETEMTAKMPPLRRQVARRVSSLQQGGLPLDVAEAVAFLASEHAGGINGQTLRVCGQNIVGA
jgi:3-oxoacyl-[acyl-carrier protein] reductase